MNKHCIWLLLLTLYCILPIYPAVTTEKPCLSAAEETTANGAESSFTALARKRYYRISGMFSPSLVIGCAYEYVLHKHLVLSRLDWQLLPAISYFLSGSAVSPYGFHIEGQCSFIQPMRTGSMTDRDFFNVKESPPGMELTHFSQHVCMLKSGMRLRLKAGIQTPIRENFSAASAVCNTISCTLEPMLGLFYLHSQWIAYNGYLQYAQTLTDKKYGKVTDRTPKKAYRGIAASYYQSVIVPAIGIGFSMTLQHGLYVYADIFTTANIIASTEDRHPARNLIFSDTVRGGYALHSAMRLEWQIVYPATFFFSFMYDCFFSTEGYTTISGMMRQVKNTLIKSTMHGTAGTALQEAVFSVGVAVVFRAGGYRQ